MIDTEREAKPGFITEEHLAYLDDVEEAGCTNIWGARPYIMVRFPELTYSEANEVIVYWNNRRDQEAVK
jgi:hypothetical protein